MGLIRLSLIILGVVLIIGIEKGAIAILIAIFALLIPIIAIVAFSPIGRAIANSINGINVSGQYNSLGASADEFNHLKDKYNKLERRFNEYEDEMNKMREALIFSDDKKISSTSVNSAENKIQQNNQINLEKNL